MTAEVCLRWRDPEKVKVYPKGPWSNCTWPYYRSKGLEYRVSRTRMIISVSIEHGAREPKFAMEDRMLVSLLGGHTSIRRSIGCPM